jgi:putative chitinase
MCIAKSVGEQGVNSADDVKTVQILLNLAHVTDPPLSQDGVVGAETLAALERFQTSRQPPLAAAMLEPGSPTLAALRGALPPGFALGKLQGIMIHAAPDLVGRFFPPLTAAMDKYQIQTPLRMAHFFAQIGHESGELRWTTEFASGDAYEGRKDLGNDEPGDGRRFKGRGLMQITGRNNYIAFGKAVGTDYTNDANASLLSSDPHLAVEASCWFWKQRGLNELADRDDLEAVTHRVNGGINGLAQRATLLGRARFFFGC